MITASLSTDLRVYATRRWPLDKDARRQERLASLLSMTKRRVRSLWENERTARPRGDEIQAIEALIGAREEKADADRAFEARIAALEDEIATLRAEMAGGAMASVGAPHGGSGGFVEAPGAGNMDRRQRDDAPTQTRGKD